MKANQMQNCLETKRLCLLQRWKKWCNSSTQLTEIICQILLSQKIFDKNHAVFCRDFSISKYLSQKVLHSVLDCMKIFSVKYTILSVWDCQKILSVCRYKTLFLLNFQKMISFCRYNIIYFLYRIVRNIFCLQI